MKLGGCNQAARSHRQGQAMPQVKAPGDQAGRNEHLLFARMIPVMEKGSVELDLGPELFQDVVLKGEVVRDGSARPGLVVNRNRGAQRGLKIEIPPSFAEGDGGCDRRVTGTVGVRT